MKHIVIIGNGISGITAARHVRKKSDARITVISAETEYFFSRTALMYVYMGHMGFEHIKPYEDWFWKKNRIELQFAKVESVDFKNRQLLLSDKNKISYDDLVIATGARPNFYGWPGQELQGVQGLVTKQDLESMEMNTRGIKRAVVVGGGLIGIEMVEMLHSRGIEVTYLVREFKFWNKVLPDDEADMVSQHISQYHIDLRLGTELKEIKGENGRVKSIITTKGEEIECGFVGIAVGVSPNVEFLKNTELKINRGVLVNQYLETNVPGVYAIGDCAEFETKIPGRLPVEQIWYTGRMHGETVAETLCGHRTAYQPKNFFNSAKLFDIEYQVYSREVVIPSSTKNIFWKSNDGRKSIRIFFNDQGIFEGVTLLGIRYRHEVCDRWLSENRSMEYVLQHLEDANFDPEFFRHHEKEVVDIYNKTYNTNFSLKKKSWLRILGKSV